MVVITLSVFLITAGKCFVQHRPMTSSDNSELLCCVMQLGKQPRSPLDTSSLNSLKD